MPPRLICLLAIVLPLVAEADVLVGRVIGVPDGDTITILVAEQPVKVRLSEIDAAERGEPWASRAKQAFSSKLDRREVEVEEAKSPVERSITAIAGQR